MPAVAAKVRTQQLWRAAAFGVRPRDSSCTTYLVSHRRQPSVDQRLGSSRATPQQTGGVAFGQVFVEPQNQRGALSVRQLLERGPQLVSKLYIAFACSA